MEVLIKKIHPNAATPSYANPGDAGFDLSSVEDLVIAPGDRALVKTGIQIQFPVGYELQVRPRSGLALKKGITVLNSPGTVDAGYRGEIGVILINHSDDWFLISVGDRIAQGVISAVEAVTFKEVPDLDETIRGQGGYGSSGINS